MSTNQTTRTAQIIQFPKPCRPLPWHADPRVLQIREILATALPMKGEYHAK